MNIRIQPKYKPWVILLTLLMTTIIFSAIIIKSTSSDSAPDVQFTLINGKRLMLGALRGRPVLIAFWATTCKPCLDKAPALNNLYRELRPEGLEIIAVAMPYDPPTRVVEFARKLNMLYPVALDFEANIVRAFGDIRVVPATLLIDPKGNIVWRKQGKLDIAQLEIKIRSLMKSGNTPL